MRAEPGELELRLNYRFRDPALLSRALMHSSLANELRTAGTEATDNEQLEFLGDSVLGFLVAEALVRRSPGAHEGELSRQKAHLVSAAHLHGVARRLDVGRFLELGRSEEMSGGRSKKTLLVDGLEAIIAAIFLDGGMEVVREFVGKHVLDAPYTEDEEAGTDIQPAITNFKSALQELAQSRGLHIIEDDSYAHLAPAHLPRMAALDGLQRTIYVSGFSKILAPNWRVGFVAAPPSLVDRFIDTKLLSTLTTPSITEQALAHCLEHGLLRRHAERVVAKLDAARSRTVRLAEQHGCQFAAPPRGLFGWLDVGVDTERLARVMLDGGWLLAPGALFHATHRPTSLMRINFASTQDARFWHALDQARATL